jgi:hypothetical protein
MKKIICLLVVALMVASVAFAAAKMRITASDLPGLKGTWEGTLSWGEMGVANSVAKLEILNDAVPVKAKITISNIPDVIASRLGLMGSTVFESDEGVITTQGTLMWAGPAKNFLEVSIKSEKRLLGWYYFRGVKGDVSLNKK